MRVSIAACVGVTPIPKFHPGNAAQRDASEKHLAKLAVGVVMVTSRGLQGGATAD